MYGFSKYDWNNGTESLYDWRLLRHLNLLFFSCVDMVLTHFLFIKIRRMILLFELYYISHFRTFFASFWVRAETPCWQMCFGLLLFTFYRFWLGSSVVSSTLKPHLRFTFACTKNISAGRLPYAEEKNCSSIILQIHKIENHQRTSLMCIMY